ncbi:hypothetical protein FG476_12265 [Xylella fastidiosa subsp. multiplex]|uniref:Uncharacterized protein n=2 Tax=Xylella fastidiosa TaxID=2371 RepID=A0A9Q4MKX9_XYLFS|nr:hypothetical protein [Xylella fastidiosa]ACA13009.1 hypothetical protein Xfasm12_2154 [Xylella fastidiosa M12]ERI59597.1 hypothetical protein M233_08665 [Xylella fastidiosa subsp. multiplex Griffin-1]KFA40978.1 hypothetical protein DF22_002448 [Xylella fastidiosa]MBE0267868.1 hypothetical protein [Xylella fastidiosa subsp. multiplex]MBE0274451.1 hypothetical protein [Xylella fastidiosa subsp. multiplex]
MLASQRYSNTTKHLLSFFKCHQSHDAIPSLINLICITLPLFTTEVKRATYRASANGPVQVPALLTPINDTNYASITTCHLLILLNK